MSETASQGRSFAEDPNHRVCAVCARVLARTRMTDGSYRWDHFPAQDHPGVPVTPDELQHLELRCDFCNVVLDLDNAWDLPCRDFVIVEGHRNAGNFAMCPACKDTVVAGRWSTLALRIYRDKKRQGSPVEPEAVTHWIELVAANVVGEPKPFRK